MPRSLRLSVRRLVLLSLLASALPGLPVAAPLAAQAAPAAGWTGTIEVDATEAPRRIFHARLSLPASPGPL
ncbi:MAG TPA: hypothetical protein VEG34_10455, partial [Thermoanaerobaculia bacterium]|nr:hypothetical protein [Thermoanaerobaculia bacterium]